MTERKIPFINIADVNCWIIYLLPFRPEERGDYEKVDNLQKACIRDKVFGMGWDVACFEYGTPMSDENIEQYKDKYKSMNEGAETSEAALSDYKQIKKGDYVIFRRKNGHYYVGRVSSEQPFYMYKPSDIVYGQFSWGAEVEKWIEYTNDSELPGEIVGRFSQQLHPTIQRIATYRQRLLVIAMYENKTGRKNFDIPKVRIGKANLLRSLNYLDLEDLVSSYIFLKHGKEGYRLIPSSCKVSQPNYEFLYLCKGKKPITCQVKNRRDIDIDRYINENGYEKVYLFSAVWTDAVVAEKRNIYSDYTNICFIGPEELFEVLKDGWDRDSDFYVVDELSSINDLNLDGYRKKAKPKREMEYSADENFVCFVKSDGLFYSSEFGALVLSWHILWDDRETECRIIEKVWNDINRETQKNK